MIKRVFYSPTNRPYVWRMVLGLCFIWSIGLGIGLNAIIESNVVGQVIQYLKAEIAK